MGNQNASASLSPNFKETELSVANAPDSVKQNAAWLCQWVLEPLRAWFGRPIKIDSGYRSPEHNKATGGVATSYHLYQGDNCAADVTVPGIAITDVFDWLRLKSTVPFSKVIMEKDHKTDLPTVVHIQAHAGQIPTLKRLAYVGETHGTAKYTAVECI